jgi:ATP adenylyltransferase
VTALRPVGDYEDLTAEELAEVMAFAGRAIRAMREESGPHGFNLSMPVVGHTKVLPALLGETYQRLRRHFSSP